MSGITSDFPGNMYKIYGTYYQDPGDLYSNVSFGSGACSNATAGGGIIIIAAKQFQIKSPIQANGYPLNQDQLDLGGSGGYIYIKQLDRGDPLQ
jgi:hypothetical protein